MKSLKGLAFFVLLLVFFFNSAQTLAEGDDIEEDSDAQKEILRIWDNRVKVSSDQLKNLTLTVCGMGCGEKVYVLPPGKSWKGFIFPANNPIAKKVLEEAADKTGKKIRILRPKTSNASEGREFDIYVKTKDENVRMTFIKLDSFGPNLYIKRCSPEKITGSSIGDYYQLICGVSFKCDSE